MMQELCCRACFFIAQYYIYWDWKPKVYLDMNYYLQGKHGR